MLWAANEMKLRRAQATCGKDATEEQIKAEYVKLGGLVINVPVNVEVADVVVEPKKKTSKK